MEVLAPLAGVLANWASVFWMSLRETSPFLVLGLVFAGLLHVFVPAKVVLWALGRGGWSGAIRGALIGTPLPLCSCGVIPTAITLRRQGASLSASTAFTISTPETSIDAIAITAALLPSVFLGVRPIAAILLAVLVGIIVEFFSTNTQEKLRIDVLEFERLKDTEKTEQRPRSTTSEICRVCGLLDEQAHQHGFLAKLRAVLRYSFVTFFQDIATWLMIGFVLAALFQVLLPNQGFESSWLGRHPNIQILAVIIVGIPLYSCATATTPLAAVLLTKGLNPGAALALLLAGPATNIGNVFMLKRELGGRATALYYGALFGLCWVFGAAFNLIWPLFSRFPSLMKIAGDTTAGAFLHAIPSWLEVACTWIILLLCVKVWSAYFITKKHDDDHHHHSHEHDGHSAHSH